MQKWCQNVEMDEVKINLLKYQIFLKIVENLHCRSVNDVLTVN